MSCGNYKQEYIGNLEYVSNSLLKIINSEILPEITTSIPFDPKNADGTCKATTATTPPTVFNCAEWESIKYLLVEINGTPVDGVKPGILVYLANTLDCIAKTGTTLSYGVAAQIERFKCLIKSLITRLNSVCCNSDCPEIIGDLLCLLMQILTALISATSKLSVLVYYSTCDITSCEANKIVASFFNCMICDFVNDLCKLENLIPELSSIVIGFATCSMQKCTPCYLASCAPVKSRPLCPPNMMMGQHGGHGSYGCSGQMGGGCGCSKCQK